jgi:hypothetical protein
MTETTPLKREIILILVGAIISASTAFLTSSFNAKREDKRAYVQKRLELNDQISRDLGKRLFFTYMYYRRLRDCDSTVAFARTQYLQSKEDWNLKVYSYQSLLKHYYGEQIRSEFITSIYNPLVELGQEVEFNKMDSLFPKKYTDLQKNNIGFVSKIYDLTEE